jgi:hypothetical protein
MIINDLCFFTNHATKVQNFYQMSNKKLFSCLNLILIELKKDLPLPDCANVCNCVSNRNNEHRF